MLRNICYSVSILLTSFLITVYATECGFFQHMDIGTNSCLHNFEYPKTSNEDYKCHWFINTTGRLKISCELILIPSDSCASSYLTIDTGNGTGDKYCGTRNIDTKETTGNELTITLFTRAGTTGGNFNCSVAAIDP